MSQRRWHWSENLKEVREFALQLPRALRRSKSDVFKE